MERLSGPKQNFERDITPRLTGIYKERVSIDLDRLDIYLASDRRRENGRVKQIVSPAATTFKI